MCDVTFCLVSYPFFKNVFCSSLLSVSSSFFNVPFGSSSYSLCPRLLLYSIDFLYNAEDFANSLRLPSSSTRTHSALLSSFTIMHLFLLDFHEKMWFATQIFFIYHQFKFIRQRWNGMEWTFHTCDRFETTTVYKFTIKYSIHTVTNWTIYTHTYTIYPPGFLDSLLSTLKNESHKFIFWRFASEHQPRLCCVWRIDRSLRDISILLLLPLVFMPQLGDPSSPLTCSVQDKRRWDQASPLASVFTLFY